MPATVLYTRQIGDGQITAAKIIAAAGIETSKLADGSNFILRNGSVAFTGSQSMGNNKITNLSAGTAASNDAARMADLTNFAITTGTLAQFATTTSAQLAGVISDETGTGSLVFSISPTFTGTPLAPTASVSTNTTQIATTAFVRTEITNLINGAPGALDTLVELATALGNDPSFSATITTALAGKEPTIIAGTTTQYWRGDKSWQTLNKTAVGLPNVDNTSDLDKPVSNPTQSALNLITAKAVVGTTTSVNITLSGEQNINGFTTSSSRILVKNQTTASQNGIYVTSAGAWTRATDFDAWTEIPGATVWVVAGTLANTGWINTNTTGGTLGTTNITFAQSAGAGAYEPIITAGTTLQYFRGDKTFQTLNSAVVPELTNLYFTNSRCVNSTLTGYGAGTNSPITNTDTILTGFGKAQVQINERELLINPGTTAQYWRGDKTFQTLNTAVVPELTNLYFTNARAIGSTLTGYVSGAGTVAATDTILQAIQKLDGNVANIVSSTVSFVTRETPSGSVNGVNTVFTLAFTPTAGSEEVYLNGMLLEPGAGNDYTVSGATITMLAIPTTGEKIRVNYRR